MADPSSVTRNNADDGFRQGQSPAVESTYPTVTHVGGEPETDEDRFYATIRPSLEIIHRVLAAADVRQPDPHRLPAADSKAMVELSEESRFVAADFDDQPVAHAHSIATLAVVAAEDYLDGLARLFEPADTAVIYAPYPILRACLEASGRCLWMADTRIGTRRRVARGKTETLHNGWTLRLMKRGGDRSQYDKEFNRDGLLTAARKLGFAVHRESGKGPHYLEEPRPGTGKAIDGLLKRLGDEEAGDRIFRHTSAIAHSTLHGLLSGLAAPTAPEVEQRTTDPRTPVMQLSVNTDTIQNIIGVALGGYLVASNERRRLFGWIDADWRLVYSEGIRYVLQRFSPISV